MDFVVVIGSEGLVFHSIMAFVNNFTVFIIDGVCFGGIGLVQSLVHEIPVNRSLQFVIFKNLKFTIGGRSVDKICKVDTALVVVDRVFALGEIEELVEFLAEIDGTPDAGLPNHIALTNAGVGYSLFAHRHLT